MSRYMMILVSNDVTFDWLSKIGKKYNLIFEKVDNYHIINQMHDDDMNCYLCQTISGETISGDYAEFDLDMVNQITNLIDENFMSKLQSKLETAKQKSKENNINFIEFVYEFFKKTHASELNLISHWYNGRIDEEKFKINRIIQIAACELSTYIYASLEDDALYRICCLEE